MPYHIKLEGAEKTKMGREKMAMVYSFVGIMASHVKKGLEDEETKFQLEVIGLNNLCTKVIIKILDFLDGKSLFQLDSTAHYNDCFNSY